MPIKLCILWAVCFAAFAAEPVPLAVTSMPPCSQRPGIRSTRSGLIQLGEVTASLTAQATRDPSSCQQTAALWITRKGVSQQVEFAEAATHAFAIIDIAPDSSSLLLTSVGSSVQMAILPLADATLKWTPVASLLNLKNCDNLIHPQGFLDPTHILISADCTATPAFFSYDTQRHTAKPSAMAGVRRFAQVVGSPLQSCKSDPDLVAACYTRRARLSVAKTGDGLQLWPVGEARTLTVDEGLLPENLSSALTPETRIYATMQICPLLVAPPSRRARACIESATNLRPER